MTNEWVLVFQRTLLDQVGTFQGIQLNLDPYIQQILDTRNTRFLLRSQAEEDLRFKQIIPYVLIKRGDSLLHYVRGKGSGEKRLVAKGSIGIGGHINPSDESLFHHGRAFYDAAVHRELHEELKTDGVFQTKIVGLLNDDSTHVGQVHFGIVHLCELSDETLSKREASITELCFLSQKELSERREHLETWSQFCLDYFPQLEEMAKL